MSFGEPQPVQVAFGLRSYGKVGCEGLVNQMKENGFSLINTEEPLKDVKQCDRIRFSFYNYGG